MNRNSVAVIALVLGSTGSALLAQTPTPGTQNVLVVVLDDIGLDKVLGEGVHTNLPPMPTLERLRREGVTFTRAYSNPTCSPTRASLMTGKYPTRTGIGQQIDGAVAPPGLNGPDRLHPDLVCIPELLGSAYARAAFGKWHLTYHSGDDLHPIVQGFELFQGNISNPDNLTNGASHFDWRRVTAKGTTATTLWFTAPPGKMSEDYWDASVARRDAIRWINSPSMTRPFFAYVCFSPPHAPFQVPPFTLLPGSTVARLQALGYQEGDIALGGDNPDPRWKRLLFYDAMLQAVDRDLGLLLEGIAAKLPTTQVIIWSDNGTPTETVQSPQDPGRAKRTIYEGGIHVPMITAGPYVQTAFRGSTCPVPVSAVDLFHTVRDIAGAPAGPAVDSVTYLPQIINPNTLAAPRWGYGERHTNFLYPTPPGGTPAGRFRAITDGQYKYLRGPGAAPSFEEFYDLAADPMELNDLILDPSFFGQITALRNQMITFTGPN